MKFNLTTILIFIIGIGLGNVFGLFIVSEIKKILDSPVIIKPTKPCPKYPIKDSVVVEYRAEPKYEIEPHSNETSAGLVDRSTGCYLNLNTFEIVWLNPILEHSEILREIKKN